ncbi:MAG: SbcC/MukB-like Walker B domain-containing protein [Balneolales bacterium]
MSTWNLFSTQSHEAGYRLEYMEVYNWGTFDGRVFTISPGGNNSLLTGSNGSGKTTFVDALLTLLVPFKNTRFYNQSSGVQKKGDRTEETYVLGNYGDMQEEGKLSTTMLQLREKRKNPYSIILAGFSNKDGKSVTLFQARWFMNGTLKREFGIAHKPLKIAEDFSPFDQHWKKKLNTEHNLRVKKNMVEFMDGSPGKYAERIVQVFGMRSNKALSLFNQTVGIKVLGNLDEFIRTNMLEPKEAGQEFEKLKDSFETLMEAQNNIEKADEQIKRLKPINEWAQTIGGFKAQAAENQKHLETSVAWFAEKGAALTAGQVDSLTVERQQKQEQLDLVTAEVKELREQEARVRYQIESDDVGRQIKELEKEIRDLDKQKNLRSSKLNSYSALAQKLELIGNPGEQAFLDNRSQARERRKKYEQELEVLESDIELEKQRDQFDDDIKQALDEIRSLQERKNNIPVDSVNIREQIIKEVGATQQEIPFIGEIIQVKSGEGDWEAAIEKLLHNFALRLMVPEKYYREVNRYVNATNLRGRIVYQRYQKASAANFMKPPTSYEMLSGKLEFNRKSEYCRWVEERIGNQFDYICTNNLDEFQSFDKSITQSGLIKSKGGKHEKDDRPHVMSRNRYVLGWDNAVKLRTLKAMVKGWQEEQRTVMQQISAKNKARADLKEKIADYRDFFRDYSVYDDINWQHYAGQIEEKQAQKESLEKANDKVKELQVQLEAIKQKTAGVEAHKDDLLGVAAVLDKTLGEHKEALTGYQDTLRRLPEMPEKETLYSAFVKAYAELETIGFDSYQQSKDRVKEHIQSERERLDREINRATTALERLMHQFKEPGESIPENIRGAWRSDVNKLSERAEFVGDYQKMLYDLQEDELPRFREKVEDYFTETLAIKIGIFKEFFDSWDESIKENIKALNESLKGITFKRSPKTYVQLKTRAGQRSANIKEFRTMLQEAIPNLAGTMDEKQHHVRRHIIPLINKLTENPPWREEVTDVRNWFTYYAEEFYRETDKSMKVYEEMGKLSGGEKAQLTYTILGSAIAYQFGLTNVGLENKSFRFIAVDESFSNQDDEKATYLMDLCKQLHLQLLVVTPSDKIHIVEPYISYVHLVERIDNKTSRIQDMPIKQFQEERHRLYAENEVLS